VPWYPVKGKLDKRFGDAPTNQSMEMCLDISEEVRQLKVERFPIRIPELTVSTPEAQLSSRQLHTTETNVASSEGLFACSAKVSLEEKEPPKAQHGGLTSHHA